MKVIGEPDRIRTCDPQIRKLGVCGFQPFAIRCTEGVSLIIDSPLPIAAGCNSLHGISSFCDLCVTYSLEEDLNGGESG